MENRFSPFYLEGLTDEEVTKIENAGFKNTALEKITKTNIQIIKDNVFTLFNFYNFFIAFALFLVGAYSNMLFILIIITNIIIGIAQEIHARNLVEKLSLVTTPKAIVIRNSIAKELSIEDIVRDDILIFDSGKQISVDSIVEHGAVETNESLLTGEADTVYKQKGDMLLSGSFVVSGKCYAKVEHIGIDNFASKLTHEAKQHRKVHSELLSAIRKVTRISTFLIIPLGLFLFFEAFVLRQDALNTSVIYTSAGILGMLPKGLVLLMSIALASGVIVLSKKKILVQELFALESLAHVDVLCLDKTGTITEGEMSVEKVFDIKTSFLPVSFETIMGSFLKSSDDNNATYIALKNHFTLNDDLSPKIKVPFSSQRKWSAITFDNNYTLVLGAPERLAKTQMPELVKELEETGSRILAIAFSNESLTKESLPPLEIIAYVAINDPVRENASETLSFFKNEGVEIKVISGDNPLTVAAIAKKAGLEKHDKYVDMSSYNDYEIIKKIALENAVFGRVTPQQKSMLIKALKENGHTVAMTGDGVNDILALREADCSIAMAEGSDAAKQVSKLVLLNSDFSSLLDVLYEGRRVVNNITRVSGIFFVKTFYSVMLSIICIIANAPFPLIPLQVAIIDAIIEGYPSFFMSFEKDTRRIKGKYLHTVFRRAFPNALTTVLGIIFAYLLSIHFSILDIESQTIMYLTIGFVGIMAVFKSCIPFNKLRIFLSCTTFIGFFTAVFLLQPFLEISPLSQKATHIFLLTAVFCLIIERIITLITNKFMTGKLTYKV